MAMLAHISRRLSIAQVVLLVFLLAVGTLGMALYAISNGFIQAIVADLATKEARIASELVFQGLYGSMRAGWSETEVEAALERARRNLPGAQIDLIRGESVALMFGDTPRAREQRRASADVAEVLSSGHELVRNAGERIDFIYPFVAKRECLSCHTNVAEGQVNGVVRIVVPVATRSLPLRAALSSMIQVFGAFTLVILVVQLFVARRLLVRPIMQLTDHILRVRRTESLAERAPLGEMPNGFLELQLLAQSFDALMQDLARTQEQLRKQSEHDELTGLMNRRSFNRCLTQELARARRYVRAVAVFVIDLDGFKGINDSHGHAAGDAVLRQCAASLERNLRENDIIARVGGDELVVAAPEMDQTTAALFREKLRRLLEQTETIHEGKTLRVGASIGAALYPWDGDSPQQLLTRADTCMYEEKRCKKLGLRR